MKILIFGKNGQVGWELQRSLAPLGEVIALDRNDSIFCGDLSNLTGIAETIQKISPNFIVNAAAYTAVDKAESEIEIAETINGLAPGIMAREAKKINAWFIQYSTDYVFDGSGEKPWEETDPTGPLGIYGKSKLLAETEIAESQCNYFVFRTSWVYAARGNNFAKTMLRLAQERDSLNVINDQIGAPTGAELLADITAQAIQIVKQQKVESGIYHLAASGLTSWHGYANFVINFARNAGLSIKVEPEAILPVPTSAFPTPAKRPHNSRLNTNKLQNNFGLKLPHWETGVSRMLTEILENK